MLCFRYPVNQPDYEQIATLLCNPYAVFYWTEGKQLTVSSSSTCQKTTNQGNSLLLQDVTGYGNSTQQVLQKRKIKKTNKIAGNNQRIRAVVAIRNIAYCNNVSSMQHSLQAETAADTP